MHWISWRTAGSRSWSRGSSTAQRTPHLIGGLFVLASTALLGCDAGSEAQPGSQASDWSIEADPTRVIGTAEGDAAQLFENIAAAVLGPNDQIVVADGGALEVRVFDASGAFAGQFGREGEGPGEFTSINGLWVTPNDQVAVWDAALRRISIFSLDGSLVTTSSITAAAGPGAGNVEPFVGLVGNGDVVLAALSFGERGAAPSADRWELVRFGSDAEVHGTLGSADGFRRAAQGPLP